MKLFHLITFVLSVFLSFCLVTPHSSANPVTLNLWEVPSTEHQKSTLVLVIGEEHSYSSVEVVIPSRDALLRFIDSLDLKRTRVIIEGNWPEQERLQRERNHFGRPLDFLRSKAKRKKDFPIILSDIRGILLNDFLTLGQNLIIKKPKTPVEFDSVIRDYLSVSKKGVSVTELLNSIDDALSALEGFDPAGLEKIQESKERLAQFFSSLKKPSKPWIELFSDRNKGRFFFPSDHALDEFIELHQDFHNHLFDFGFIHEGVKHRLSSDLVVFYSGWSHSSSLNSYFQSIGSKNLSHAEIANLEESETLDPKALREFAPEFGKALHLTQTRLSEHGLAPKPQEICSQCLIPLERVLSCGGCKKTTYCSADCQKMDWKAHKKNCKPNDL